MKNRNCHLAMHLVGNHGAGAHTSDYYYKKNLPLADGGDMSDDELEDYIKAAIESRESHGITRHYNVNFLPAARLSDIDHCLDKMADSGFLYVKREYRCTSCGLGLITGAADFRKPSDCCSNGYYKITAEFFQTRKA